MAEESWEQADLAVDIVADRIERLILQTRDADLSVQAHAARQLEAFVRLYRELTGDSEEQAAARFLK